MKRIKNKNKPMISIVVISYNSERTIDKCLNSLVRQTLPPSLFEIIVINDHSTDKTVSIVQKYPKVKTIEQRYGKKGRPSARNTGILSAKGDVIAFTDSDCIPSPNWIKNVHDYITNYPNIAGIGGSMISPNNQNFIGNFESSVIEAYGYDGVFPTANSAYKKSVLINIGLFDENLITGEDLDLNWRIQELGKKLQFVNSLKVKHLGRDSFTSFVKHHFEYGRSRAMLIDKHPTKFSKTEKNIVSLLVTIIFLLIISIIVFKNIILILDYFLFIMLMLIVISYGRRIKILKYFYQHSKYLELFSTLILFPIIDVANLLGILYQKFKNYNKP